MSDDILESLNLNFEPSTLETIDKSVMNYMAFLNLFAQTNEGWKKVPIIWGTAERSFQSKNNKNIRDSAGALVFPIITVTRTSTTKTLASKGVFQGNIWKNLEIPVELCRLEKLYIRKKL